jgi:hypothetical protein
VLVHLPDNGHVTTRSDGGSATRPRGLRRRAERAGADPPVPSVPAPQLAPTEATRRWAAVRRQRVEVDPLVGPVGARARPDWRSRQATTTRPGPTGRPATPADEPTTAPGAPRAACRASPPFHNVD